MSFSNRDRKTRQDSGTTSNVLSLIGHGLRRASVAISGPERVDAEQGSLGLNLLHGPSEPRIDFIFVHGLGGGSQKTWSHSDDPNLFWPKKWLPFEDGFENVRIHSFGYKSQWDSKGTILNILDFGQTLIAAIHNSPCFRRDANTKLVFIAHSMGGVVVKKAYLLAKQDPDYVHILERIHSIFFLATPHRGADTAQYLKRILRLPGLNDTRVYVDEIMRNSVTMQDINESFRHAYCDIQLWSFYETINMKIGPTAQIIVEKDSAILGDYSAAPVKLCARLGLIQCSQNLRWLGFPHERVQPIAADHRHICKFKDRSDSNYIALYHSFLVTIEEIDKGTKKVQKLFENPEEKHRAQEKIILNYLSGPQKPEAEHNAIVARRAQGSCEWLIKKQGFRVWFEMAKGHFDLVEKVKIPKCFWLSGKPGVGKSTAAGHVVTYIRACGFDCSFYFFNSGDKTKSSVSEMLKSLAYQMACVNEDVRESMLSMVEEDEELRDDDFDELWRKLFLSKIFRIEFRRPHYWIIDGLDECKNYHSFFPLLSELDKLVPLRVFITSRSMPTIDTHFKYHGISVLAENITVGDSLNDIGLFLRTNTQLLSVEDEVIRGDLVARILEKSNGCFLWVSLVLDSIEHIRGWRAILNALDEVPAEMNDLYAKMVKNISSVPQNVNIVKSILRWTMCAMRPLTVDELQEALYLDIEETVPSLQSAIASLCGHLVYVDSDSRVHPVHQTVRTFLTKQCPVSEFAMDKRQENGRLAEICLTYLAGKSLVISRAWPCEVRTLPRRFSAFSYYASHHFADHLFKSYSELDAAFLVLHSFLTKPNVLTWIEILASVGNLSALLATAKNVRSYLGRRANYRSPIGKEVQITEAWVDDIIHITALFGRNLLSSPTSIHFLVPPVCPLTSQIHTRFGSSLNGLKAVGGPYEKWDDRLTCFLYPKEEVLSVAYRDTSFAVGLSNGMIMLYRSITFEFMGKLDHGEPVEKLAYGNVMSLSASSSLGRVALWDSHRLVPLWATEQHSRLSPMELSFSDDDRRLFLALENSVATFLVSDGRVIGDFAFGAEDEEEETGGSNNTTDTFFSPGLHLVATIYRRRPISIWNLERGCCQYRIAREVSEGMYETPQATSVAFHPNQEVGLLAAAYNDGELVLHNFRESKQEARFEMLADVIAASPDGRTLAAGDVNGDIYLFAFDTLRLLYRIEASDGFIQDIVFASNSLRFIDIREDRANVWEPSVLVRRDSSDDASSEPYSEELLLPAIHAGLSGFSDDRTISAIVGYQGGNYLFCGRSDGSVAIYESSTARVVQELYSHTKNMEVHLLNWIPSKGIITSADRSCRYICRKVWQDTDSTWHTGPIKIDERTDTTIIQILTSPSSKRLLLSTARNFLIWNLDDGSVLDSSYPHINAGRWANHPSDPAQLLFVDSGRVDVFDWSHIEKVDQDTGIVLAFDDCASIVPAGVMSSRQRNTICVNYVSRDTQKVHLNRLAVWDASSIHSGAVSIRTLAQYESFPSGFKAIVGIYKAKFLFLDSDGWVCSVNIGMEQPQKHFTKHFFIPYIWHSAEDPIFSVLSNGSIAFGVKDKVTIFQGGLDFEEPVAF